MEAYKCVVYDSENKRRVLSLDLASEAEVLKYAKKNNLKVSSIKKKKTLFSKKLKDKELKLLCKQIEILFKSGCEITKLLDILKLQSSKKVKNVLSKISEQIEQGNTITEAFNSTNCFSSFFINTLYTGEISSNLDNVMAKLSEYYDKEDRLKSKILTISIYPLILTLAVVLVVLVMLFFIIPQYEEMFIQNNMELPTITMVVINISRFVRKNYIVLFLGIIIFTVVMTYILRTNQEIRLEIYKFMLKVPVVGNYLLIQMTSKFSKALCILTQSGVDIISAIDASAKVIDKKYIYDMIDKANESVKEGNGVGISLSRTNIFPKLFTNFISIGEQTGRLDEILEIVNEYYENELDRSIEKWMKCFENMIILVMGGVVGLILVCIVLPMFNAVSGF